MEQLGTIGDRILHLLRSGGRADRGVPYEQKDLVAWLCGDAVAPDGKLYNIAISKSTVSRIVNGTTEAPISALIAISEIFHVELEWLATGKVREEAPAIEAFVSAEANRVGQIVEAVDDDIRALLLHMAEELLAINEQRQDLRTEVYTLLTESLPTFTGDMKVRANSVIRKVHSRGTPGSR